MTRSIQEKARQALDWFVWNVDLECWQMRDGHNTMAQNLAWAAHEDGNILPDNYRYEYMMNALEFIANSTDDALDAYEDIVPDSYTFELTEWLNSSERRVFYLSEAITDGNDEDGYHLLASAQTEEMWEVFYAVHSWLERLEWLEQLEDESEE